MSIKRLKLIETDEDFENTENTEEIAQDEENTAELEDVVDEEKTEDDETLVDSKLNELREILPDLNLSLYRIANNEKDIYYIIGKLDDDGESILMLTERNPEKDTETTEPIKTKDADEVIQNEDEDEEVEKVDVSMSDEIEDINKEYEFVTLPYELDNVLKLAPIYSNNDENKLPNHDKLMDYLMQQLIEIDPDKAEEIKSGKDVEDEIEVADEEIPDEEIIDNVIDDEEEVE